MVFTKLLLENALAIRPCNWEAASEPLLPKVALCMPVLPSSYIGKYAARVLKRSELPHSDLGLSVRARLFKNVFELFHVKTSIRELNRKQRQLRT